MPRRITRSPKWTVARLAPGLDSLLRYERRWLRADVAAGLSVAAVALPTGVAYADLVQVPAVVGIYAAIFPLFAYAVFGSSRQLVTGPDSATCVLVAATLTPLAAGHSEHYVALVVVLTLVTGIIHLLAALLRLGFLASFLSQPILTGFMHGIAIIIIAGQLKTLFGYAGTASDFFATLAEFARSVEQAHAATLVLGLGLLVALVALHRVVPRAPQAMIVLIAGIVLVTALDLDERGVSVVGAIPAGLPTFSVTIPSLAELTHILSAAASIALITFISGVLTGKSWARRNRYDIDANQELVAFAACNFAAGFAQGFPVSGTDSRTAVSNAMGGKTQLTGVVAGWAMLCMLFFLTEPLTRAPKAALAAVIVVSAFGLFDYAALRKLYGASRIEFWTSLCATAGVLVLGVLPGVVLTVGLSLAWLLKVAAKPPVAVLGRVPGLEGYYDVEANSRAESPPGVLIYQFCANLVYFNVDHFKQRAEQLVASAGRPVHWLIVDASPVNYVDVTAMQKVDEMREDLAARGVTLVVAHPEPHLLRFFDPTWVRRRRERDEGHVFPTIDAAVRAYEQALAPPPQPNGSNISA